MREEKGDIIVSGFEISSMTDATMQKWATKCDANFDGIIDDNEMPVFQQGQNTMQKPWYSNQDMVVIDGVRLAVDDIKTIKKNDEGSTFDYAVEFNSGIKAQFDKQNEDNEAYIGSHNTEYTPTGSSFKVYTATSAFNFADDDGIEITGTQNNDYIGVENSKISSVNGRAGLDRVNIDGCVGNKKDSPIYAEETHIMNSENLSVKREAKKILRPTIWDKTIQITKENPNYTSPSLQRYFDNLDKKS